MRSRGTAPVSMKNISKSKTGNGNKAQDTTVKAGSELDRVYRGVKKHPGLTKSGVGKALRWKYGPGRALKKLVEIGLLTLDKKNKTFTVKA